LIPFLLFLFVPRRSVFTSTTGTYHTDDAHSSCIRIFAPCTTNLKCSSWLPLIRRRSMAVLYAWTRITDYGSARRGASEIAARSSLARTGIQLRLCQYHNLFCLKSHCYLWSGHSNGYSSTAIIDARTRITDYGSARRGASEFASRSSLARTAIQLRLCQYHNLFCLKSHCYLWSGHSNGYSLTAIKDARRGSRIMVQLDEACLIYVLLRPVSP